MLRAAKLIEYLKVLCRGETCWSVRLRSGSGMGLKKTNGGQNRVFTQEDFVKLLTDRYE